MEGIGRGWGHFGARRAAWETLSVVAAFQSGPAAEIVLWPSPSPVWIGGLGV